MDVIEKYVVLLLLIKCIPSFNALTIHYR